MVLLFVLLAAGCGSGERRTPDTVRGPSSLAAGPRLLLVTFDGVRAREIFDGVDPALAAAAGLDAARPRDARALTPELHRLIDRGVALGGPEAPMVASGPRFVSLPGYREILTGRAGDGRCTDNDCPALTERTLLDELRGGEGEVVAIASWERIGRAASGAPGALWTSVGRHGGATRDRLAVDAASRAALDAGRRAAAWPGHADYRPDAYTARLALAVARAAAPRVLYVGLGDTDEYAHRNDYRGYLDALAAADAALGRLVDALGRDDTIVLVTADHGRSFNFRDHGDSPESSGVWLVAAGGSIAPQGVAHTNDTRHLCDIAPTIRALLHLPVDESSRAGHIIGEIADLKLDRVASRLSLAHAP